MDNWVFPRTNGNRSISASAAERTLLLGALATHIGVLDTRENDTQTVTRKAELWDEITRHFNSRTTKPRSKQQIQTLYKNMKAKARRYEARKIEVENGFPPPETDPISEMLLGLLRQQIIHQKRQLKHLMNKSSCNFPPEASQSTINHQNLSTSSFVPEQVMQVVLNEGTNEEIDIKYENEEEDVEGTSELNKSGSSSSSTKSPNSLEFYEHTLLPTDVSELNDESKLISSPVSSLKYDIFSPSVNGNYNDEDPLQNLDDKSSEEIYSRKLESPSCSKEVEDRKISDCSQQSVHDIESNKISDPLNTIRKSKSFYRSEQFQTKRSFCDTWLDTTKFTIPKRVCLDNSLKHQPSASKCLCSQYPEVDGNLVYSCMEIQLKILSMAQEEHEMKLSLLKRQMEQKDHEHQAKMKSLTLELEETKLRIVEIKKSHPIQRDSDKDQNHLVDNDKSCELKT